jgi:hypothetical protein
MVPGFSLGTERFVSVDDMASSSHYWTLDDDRIGISESMCLVTIAGVSPWRR